MKFFLKIDPRSLIIGLLLFLNLKGYSQCMEYQTFYIGKNIYVQNPMSVKENKFCVIEVYLNGLKVMDSINSPAFEIDLSRLKLADSANVVFIHKNDCKPKILESGPIQPPKKFSFNRVYISNGIIYLTTRGEGLHHVRCSLTDSIGQFLDYGNHFYIEMVTNKGWKVIDFFKGNESALLNNYKIKIKNVKKGFHMLRIKWVDNNGEEFYSPLVVYSKEK